MTDPALRRSAKRPILPRMKTEPTPSTLDFALAVVAIRLAAVTLTAWIYVAAHGHDPQGGRPLISAEPLARQATEAAPLRRDDADVSDMLAHD